MTFLFAILPILLVLALMLFFKRGSHQAGFAGWAAGVLLAILVFGLNWQVFWVSQVKGLLLSLNVIAILWAALILLNLVDQVGGVRAIALALQEVIPDKGWLLIVQAWMVTALVENLAGFGLPIAIVAPMLIALGVNPVSAVAATAIGHTWAVSMGGMALAFRTMTDIVKMDPAAIFPTAAVFLGLAALLSGLAVALVLGQMKHWWRVVILSVVVGLTQYLVGRLGLITLSSFSAAIIGVIGGAILSKRSPRKRGVLNSDPALKGGLLSYGFLFLGIITVSLIRPINEVLSRVTWTMQFPQVISLNNVVTQAGPGYLFRPLVHPATLLLLSAIFAAILLPRIKPVPGGGIRSALKHTAHGAIPASLGALFMIGLSSLMEHTGMTTLIAEGLSRSIGTVYPLISPLMGMLGAFATGSNTNSNILFGPMQKGVAVLLKISPIVLLAAQTTGGSLGSMIAPAKLAVGSSTNSMKGREGEVLRITLPIGLVIGLLIGLLVWFVVSLG